MSTITFRTLDGGTTDIDHGEIARLEVLLRGEALSASSAGYDEARAVWNAMIDRRPGLIVRCQGAADVAHCVRFARSHDLLTCVRGGGHHVAGNSVADDALMIDLSPMRFVRVDAEERRALIGPGAILQEVDAETQAFGLALPVGINSTTGIAGLTLGGGFGWLTRKLGLTIDSLVSADVVTAEGSTVRASADSHPDLFWALRGGGGNFGIVTAFEFDLHEVGPEVIAGLIVYPIDEGEQVLRGWQAAAAEAPDDLSVFAVLRQAPPLPFLPEEVHGSEVAILAVLHQGDPAAAVDDIAPFTRLGTVLGDHVDPMPLVAFQQAFDGFGDAGARNYWKSHDFARLSEGFLAAAVAAGRKLPSPECEVIVAQLGGAMGRVPVDATAYPGREAAFVMNVHARWRAESDDERCIAWARELFKRATPHALGTAYINFMTADEATRLETAYGRNFQRLMDIKDQYDPDNFFRVNLNLATPSPSRP